MFPDDSDLDVNFTLESEESGVVEERPFRLLVLGDWTGDGARRDLAARRPIEIDRDNFEDVMNGLGVTLGLETAGGTVDLEFRSLDDFHPDELFKRVPLFTELRDLRKRLRNSDTFNSAAREVRELVADPTPAAQVLEERAVEPRAAADNLLDAILSKPEGGAVAPNAVSLELSKLVSDLVRPHLVTVDENEQSAMVAAVDEAIGSAMRSILHNRRFQLLEAAWRGLFFLVRRTDTTSDLKIFILNISKDELTEDLKAGDSSVIAKLLKSGKDGDPWAAVVGNFAFLPDIDDTAALIRLAKCSASTRSPFISHIRPEVIGVSSLADHPDAEDWDLSDTSDAGKLWSALRGMPEAKYLGLTMPRFLARLPYGAATEPTETFSFEEFTEDFGHDDYLWTNSCFAVGQLLAATYREFEWEFGQQFVQDINDLPLHMYKKDGLTVYQSCAEVQLSQSAAEKLMDHGIMPIVSFKNVDRIRLARFQSVSDPVSVLKGRWSG